MEAQREKINSDGMGLLKNIKEVWYLDILNFINFSWTPFILF